MDAAFSLSSFLFRAELWDCSSIVHDFSEDMLIVYFLDMAIFDTRLLVRHAPGRRGYDD